MNSNFNSKIIGKHAFLSPSNYHWLDYDEEKLRRVYYQKQQAALGDSFHEYAQRAITLRVKQADNGTTLSMYINDAIGFRMNPEVPLYYSDDCFGTADACGFREERWPDGIFYTLRISDLKTGVTPADMKQVKIYVGLFCLQYKMKPEELRIVMRIYQNDTIIEELGDSADILMIIDRIKTQAALVAYLREED